MTVVIEHVTLTTGHRSQQQRSRYKLEAIDSVRSALASGAELGGGFTLDHIPSPPGAHAYAINFDGSPMVVCVLCADKSGSEAAWSSAMTLAPADKRHLNRPEAPPWLASAIVVNSAALFSDFDRMSKGLSMVSDLSVLVAWAIID